MKPPALHSLATTTRCLPHFPLISQQNPRILLQIHNPLPPICVAQPPSAVPPYTSRSSARLPLRRCGSGRSWTAPSRSCRTVVSARR